MFRCLKPIKGLIYLKRVCFSINLKLIFSQGYDGSEWHDEEVGSQLLRPTKLRFVSMCSEAGEVDPHGGDWHGQEVGA